MLSRLFAPKVKVSAHCDLPCGVYDPAQARIEAESVKAVQEKYQANEDPHFRARATVIKEQRAELAKHHVSVLWSDYFKPPHFEKYPELHQLVNDTLKALAAAKGVDRPGDRPEGCWTTSPRSTRSSGRPRRPDERSTPQADQAGDGTLNRRGRPRPGPLSVSGPGPRPRGLGVRFRGGRVIRCAATVPADVAHDT